MMQISSSLQRIIQEDAVGQLRRREGLMARLGSEGEALKLDWVEGVARLLTNKVLLEQVEAEAQEIWHRGIRHIIWAGMGGSIITVRALTEMGFCTVPPAKGITIYPLDSTDPAALNAIVRTLARGKGLSFPSSATEKPEPDLLQKLFNDVMMIGVSMGMTSEEPITHLTWFTSLIEQAHLQPAEHLMVMTLPGSYLDQFAQEHGAPRQSLQPDGGNGTGGRMSAPTTRVFLLPVALHLLSISQAPGQLFSGLEQAWQTYNLDLATTDPVQHPFVRLAAALSDASMNGVCSLLLQLPTGWQPLRQWIEQLMEESLGKGGKGIVVFDAQVLNKQAPTYSKKGTLRVVVSPSVGAASEEQQAFVLEQPYLASEEPVARLAALAASFMGWQLTMALYGYLQDITFAGQPAVENYKARARTLRMQDPLQTVEDWPATCEAANLRLLAPSSVQVKGSPASVFARTIQQAATSGAGLFYLDFTVNGVLPEDVQALIAANMQTIANTLLGVPVKLRVAPAAYHSTEQSEMDGRAGLVSLRLLTREHEPVLLGSYTDTFLCAQAVSTWQAMIEEQRTCFLLLINNRAATSTEMLTSFFQEVISLLQR